MSKLIIYIIAPLLALSACWWFFFDHDLSWPDELPFSKNAETRNVENVDDDFHVEYDKPIATANPSENIVESSEPQTSDAVILSDDEAWFAVRVMDDLANGQCPGKWLEPRPAAGSPEIRRNSAGAMILISGFAKVFAPQIQQFCAMSSDQVTAIYCANETQLQTALEKLGYQDLAVRQLARQAMDTLLSLPPIPENLDVVPSGKKGIFYYRQEQFEKLNEAQKAFLRLGPDSCRQIISILQQVNL